MTDTIHQQLEDVRRRLLDLTRRNRLLNHRDTGKRTLRTVHELPQQVLERMLAGKKFQFLAREEAPAEVAELLDPFESPDHADSDALAFDLAPIRRSGDPQKDDCLQTLMPGPALQDRLLKLSREADSALREQGYNILFLTLGMVEWKEDDNDPVSRAPLLFIPVDLDRKNINSRHDLRWRGEDVLVNPSLAELCKREFGFDLPEFDETAGIDPLLEQVREAIPMSKGWKLEDEIHLGLFSFQKLLMWRDLDPSAWPEGSLTSHKLIRVFSGDEAADLNGQMPDAEKLDDEIAPADNFQVMDADSSQQSAIIAAKRGLDLVIDGPPGTGKSQTIANIIAELLAEGKSVLFVAEKSAALDVVKRRLEKVGLGDFALELHSRKTSKRLVLGELQRVLNQPPGDGDDRRLDGAELQNVRDRLNAYARQLHRPTGAQEMTVYEAIGRLVELADTPDARADLKNVMQWDAATLTAALERLRTIDSRLHRVGNLAEHPWRGVGLTAVGFQDVQKLGDQATAVGDTLGKALKITAALADHLGTDAPRKPNGVQQLLRDAKTLLIAPKVRPDVLDDPRLVAMPTEVEAFVGQLRLRNELKTQWAALFKPDAETEDWADVLDRRRKHGESFTRLFRPSWYADSKRLKRGAATKLPPTPQQIKALQAIGESRRVRSELEIEATQLAALLGESWQGPGTDPNAVLQHVEALINVRKLVARGGATLSAAKAAVTSDGREILRRKSDPANAAVEALQERLRGFFDQVQADPKTFLDGEWLDTDLPALRQRLADLPNHAEKLTDLTDLNAARQQAGAGVEAPFLDWALTQSLPEGQLADVFERHFLRLWLETAMKQLPALHGFRGEEFQALTDRFRQLDLQWLEATRTRLAAKVDSRKPDYRHKAQRQSKLGVLQAEARKKTRHMPLRKLLATCGDVIKDVKPCFMMSPISVAQYLQPGAIEFDVVIFDEASQIEPADAFGAIARGKQLILVGDEKQLPPTNFFGRVEGDSEWDDDEDIAVEAGDLESILSLGIVRLPHRSGLRWHYRSKHASLIAFSNRHFYDGQLRVFPSPDTDRRTLGVTLRKVDGIYKRGKGRTNPDEAKAVAEAVIEHARTTPQWSLGVAALNLPQQQQIMDEVEKLRRDLNDKEIESFFAGHEDEPFFVKNLESVQGDERDVMFISVAYGRDADGKLSMNFGPLNADGGWRRLNVLVTRAKRRCVVFSTISADDFPADLTAEGVSALRDYLYFAEHGRAQSDRELHDPATPVEAVIAAGLREKGWTIRPQVGEDGFAVPLGIVDPEDDGRFLAGIECDGRVYDRCPTARDRERTRPSVLQMLGWDVLRLWSPDVMRDPAAVVERLDQELRAEQIVEAAAAPEIAVEPPVVEVEPPAPKPPAEESAATVPYTHVRNKVVGNVEDLKTMPASGVARQVHAIINAEGPIHVDEAVAALADRFGTKRSKGVRRCFEKGLAKVLMKGNAVVRGKFIWPAGVDPANVVPRRRDAADCPVTRPDHIPAEELEAAVRVAVEKEYGLTAEALPVAAARVMGFDRTSPTLRTAFEDILHNMRDRGSLIADGDFLQLPSAG